MHLLRRLGWASLDQGVSSLSNLLLSVAIASQASQADYGAFGLAFAIYLLLIGIGRSLVGDPVLLRFNTWTSAKKRRENRLGMLSGFFVVGILACVILLVFCIFLPMSLRFPFMALALMAPGLLVFDGLRYWAFASSKARTATILDIGWLICQVALFVPLIAMRKTESFLYFGAWGTSAGLCCLVFLIYKRWIPRPSQGLSWIKSNLDISLNFLGEYATLSGVQQGVTFVTAAVAGLPASGTLRAAQTILGPANIITGSASVVVLPHSSRVVRDNILTLPRFSAIVSVTLAGVVLAAGLVVAVVPQSLGLSLFGASWLSGRDAALVLAISLGFNALSYGATSGLRALGLSKISLRVRVSTAPITLAASSYGAVTHGALGAVGGLALSAGVLSIIWWVTYLVSWKRVTNGEQ